MSDSLAKPDLTIRTMSEAELARALDWAAAEGWNPGLHDAACFRAADPDGFLVAELNGEAVGCIAAAAYDESFGSLGAYIVLPEFRGRQNGLALWDGAVKHLGGRTVGLDAVAAQEANYEKSGFRRAYRNVRFEGVIGSGPADVVNLSEVPFAEVLAYDRAHFPARREEFLRRWVRQPGGAALGVMRDGRLIGYGVIRACRRGFKIGPLFADDEQTAEELFRGLASRASGEAVVLDAPEANPAALALAHRFGMHEVFATARMYANGTPVLPLARVFGVTSLELG